ncbi:hypothetical protein BCBD1442_02440 [Brucella ceti]|nr:hypothetical protein BCBD1442_02440 [Brucella ceti]
MPPARKTADRPTMPKAFGPAKKAYVAGMIPRIVNPVSTIAIRSDVRDMGMKLA